MTAADRPEASWRPVVGERVRLGRFPHGGFHRPGTVLSVDRDIAWVRWDGWSVKQPEAISDLIPATDGVTPEEAP